MPNKTELVVHLVWATWNRQPLITGDVEAFVFRAIDAKCVDLRVVGGELHAKAEFPPAGVHPLADTVYGLIQAGMVNATSIGFRPIERTPNELGGLDFTSADLMEYSFVPVPAKVVTAGGAATVCSERTSAIARNVF